MVYDVREYGATGDGIADDSAAIQAVLAGGEKEIFIPAGNYRICRTLRVDSFTTIAAAPEARLFLCGETEHNAEDFLLTNSDHACGNTSIEISGGVWDGNKAGRTNFKAPDLFNQEAYTGTVLNFRNVHGLKLHDLVVANSAVYFIRLCQLEDFHFRNIGFRSEIIENNQDGLHFNGFVRNGLVEDIRALTPGQTNDDFIALNADDAMNRLENTGMCCGPIENILFRDLYAEDCHTLIRMLSFISPIRNIRFENVTGGCRCFAVNMDAARYCRTPLFRDADFPAGVGCIEDVEFDGLTVWMSAAEKRKGMIDAETRVRNFRIRNFRRDPTKDRMPEVPVLVTDKTPGLRIAVLREGRKQQEIISDGTPWTLTEPFTGLQMDS